MRRKDKKIEDRREIESIIERANVCRIGLCDEGVPYIVPLVFGYKNSCLYFHSATEGKKIEIIRKTDTACFEIDIDKELVKAEDACSFSMKYRSIIGFGEIQIVDDTKEKIEALNTIMSHYTEENFQYPKESLQNVAVIKIKIEEMTGKKSGY
ncbi:pyridoxamine 5'-phosphate oxidase [candidate division MSBL1 archaeon SCGC-AAA259I14]|uniref:Pyridoxamine 5'-phosphate oxidase n=4 Tax=candidate division MSBL1 TaxID=215777 RepID=A0A133UR46_9EURY|nr:pyridoxamine 5'-phosphate oxidase [candidate division MSBL1 archaeon SCGC-AAA259B11]KXA92392.1 pyridoxamine 5'-phosphate oxidase [candidate division MSBL1 archaeon SCGC-AAA259E22]KXA96668.1 pyridoxamine 5'-phosphate oxidase [candidate division MSBL1 archaeon SCGC-AAA259I14]